MDAQRHDYAATKSIVLPPEIHDLILDHLSLPAARPGTSSQSRQHAIDRSTLRTCVSVWPTFRSRAYARLYSSVVLEAILAPGRYIQRQAAELARWAQLFSASANTQGFGAVRYIKTFSFVVEAHQISATDLHAFIQNGCLATILDALHGPDRDGVESLTLIVEPPDAMWAYSDSSQTFQRAFEDLIRSRNLKHLQVNAMTKIPRNLFRNTNIQKIELYNASSDVNILDILQPTAVKSIGLDEATLHLNQPSSGMLNAALNQMHYRLTSPHSIPNVIDIAAQTAKYLQSFHIHLSGQHFASGTPLSPLPCRPIYHFCRLRRLSSLRISKVVGAQTLDEPQVIYILRHLLSLSTLPPTLCELTLDTTARAVWDSGGAGQELLPHPDEWRALDALLARQPYSAIHKVTVIIRYYVTLELGAPPFEGTAFAQRARERFLDALPRFFAARRCQRDVKVLLTVHDLEADNPAGPGNGFGRGIVVRFGGRDKLNFPFSGGA